jgi:hypothetical protein
MMPEWKAVYVKHNHEIITCRYMRSKQFWQTAAESLLRSRSFPATCLFDLHPEKRHVLMAPGVVCLTGENGFGAITAVEIARLRKAVTRGETPRLPRSLESLASSTHGRSQGTTPGV